jgi:general secretion pathway protein G
MMERKYVAPGFSLMEILVALFILGLVMAVGIPSYLYIQEMAAGRTTRASLQVLKNSINLFKMEHGKYPARLQDLVERPKGEEGKAWKPLIEKLPKDGWKQDFYYKLLPSGSKHPYELYSYGVENPEESTPESRISVWDV